ncbi:MAG TPA: hypothetical protein PLB55_14740 [Prosthecobacter sp.]|nr:hypothetical protein [Prosthecobacter sp.]
MLFKATAWGVLSSGLLVLVSTFYLRNHLSRHYQANITALAATITEVDGSVKALQQDASSSSKYLDSMRWQLQQTRKAVDALNTEVGKWTDLLGTTAPKTLLNAASALSSSSKMVNSVADKLGAIPFDPAANERKNLYEIKGNLAEMAGSLHKVGDEVGGLTGTVGTLSRKSLESAAKVLADSEEQLDSLGKGSLDTLPGTLAAFSQQLRVHLVLIESSSDLVHWASLPLIAIGLGFLFAGIAMTRSASLHFA